MNLLLQHTPQPSPWGCQYYALYSLVGDERILADVTEASPNRFNTLMAELGYHLHPLWVDQTSNCPTTPAWWAKVLSWDATGYCAGDAVGITPLLLHLPTHCAGAAVLGKPGLPVVVFDPTQPEQLRFETLADFSTSTYGQCIMVSEVSILRGLDFFPAAFAPRLPHVRPEVRETTQGMRLS